MQSIPPKSDPHLPRGGQRLWFFEPTVSLPMLIITTDETGREVEYYCHDRFMYPVHLTDDDFNPDVLWKTAPARERVRAIWESPEIPLTRRTCS